MALTATEHSQTPPAAPAPAGSRNPYGSRALIGRLWRDYLRPHRAGLLLAFALMVIEGSTLAALSYMLEPLFDRVFIGGDSTAIWWVGAGIMGLFAVRAVTMVSSKTLLTHIALKSSTAMQSALLRHLLTLEVQFFQTNPPGALIERVQGDTLAVQGVWQALITGIGRDILSLLALMTVAVMIDPLWTAAALIGAPLLILPALAVQRYVRRKTMGLRVRSGERATHLDEVFHGITTIKLNGMETYQADRFERIVRGIVRGEVRVAFGRAVLPGTIDIVTGLGFFMVLVLGGTQIIAGERSVGEFMSFFTAMALAFQPLRRLGAHAGTWQVGAASLERLYRFFDIRPSILTAAPRAATPALPASTGSTAITLEDVHLAYGDMPVLRGLSFRAEAGRRTAIVGPSGAGKSTVFNLLTRLIDPQSGRIAIGGVDIGTVDPETLRSRFAVVSQDAWLFDETLRENILLGRRDVSDARLAEVLEAANAAEFVARLPLGLDTPSGPRGSGLSGGQRQRIAIARALLRDAPVLLMDEATSALDAASEVLVTEALDRLSVGRTTLVIAHRLSTVQGADSIVVMDGGRAVDQGSHRDLIARGGLYADLCRLQFDRAD